MINKKSFRKNKRAVSDVIAVLLMIAIAVAAALIAYAWVMGYLGGTTSKVGKTIQIQSMYYSDGTTLHVYVQNVGTSPVTLSALYINGASGTSLTGLPADLPVNNTKAVTADLPLGFNPANAITVKVVCSDGTFMEATQIVPGS